MKTSIRNLSLLTTLIAGLGLIPAGRVSQQIFAGHYFAAKRAAAETAKSINNIMTVLRWFIVVACMAPFVMRAQMIRPDVEVGMLCLDAATGKAVWQHWFGRKLMFTGYQFSDGKAVVRFYGMPSRNDDQDHTNKDSAAFLDMKTGKTVLPFYLPVPSCELVLSNGWSSQGVTNLAWHNIGTNLIYFFDAHSNMVWKMTLPEGAYNLANWHDVLVYSQYVEEHKNLVDHLFGQTAGKGNPIWEFILPNDIPSLDQIGGDFIGPKNYLRTFTYKVGKDSILVFGGGTLFSLAPTTGIVEWRSQVSSDTVVKRSKSKFNSAYVAEAGGDLLLLSDQTLLRFKKASRPVISLLRDDIDMDSFYQGKLPVYIDGKIYCVIDRR
jgi:outer membrane protein assembly factor BamB